MTIAEAKTVKKRCRTAAADCQYAFESGDQEWYLDAAEAYQEFADCDKCPARDLCSALRE